jgi:two-component system, OmpR family, KDP operon response regulator KdpE
VSGQRVLVVDDEPQIVRGLRVILRNAGYDVEASATREEALDALSVRPPDLMVLDLKLPDGSGIDVLESLRAWSALPVIVVSAVGDEREKVRALDAGADDYITKPFGADELTARLRALLRRAGDNGEEPAVTLGDLKIDLASRSVARDGERIHLTPIEYDLLAELTRHRGKLVTQRQLLSAVWGPAYTRETHYLRVHIAHLRAKLERDPSRPRHILTEPGVGYRLLDPP